MISNTLIYYSTGPTIIKIGTKLITVFLPMTRASLRRQYNVHGLEMWVWTSINVVGLLHAVYFTVLLLSSICWHWHGQHHMGGHTLTSWGRRGWVLFILSPMPDEVTFVL